MREIKFRLRDRKNKIMGYVKWYEGSYNKKDCLYTAPPQWLYSPAGIRWEPIPILHRYKDLSTTLLDKNGKEIFEGDLAETRLKAYLSDVIFTYTIEYENGCFVGKALSMKEGPLLKDFNARCEVVGNIYEPIKS